jgi:hypothetical protein
MLEDKVFVVKLIAVDGFAPCAVTTGKISTLTHKTRNNAMEAGSLEMQWLMTASLTAFSGTQGPKIVSGFGSHILSPFHDNAADGDVTNGDVKENLGIVGYTHGLALGIKGQRTTSIRVAHRGPVLIG